MSEWAYDEDRTYHGVPHDEADWRIEVELAEFGPTERLGATVLRSLEPVGEFAGFQFGWGYNGTGTSAAAYAILHDALDGQEPSRDLREDFCEDVLSQLTDEWRLRRGAVLRWIRGWCAERQVDVLPTAAARLPPVHRGAYAQPPEAIREERKRRIYGKQSR